MTTAPPSAEVQALLDDRYGRTRSRRARVWGWIVVCALAALLWCGTPSARAQAPAGSTDDSKQYLPIVSSNGRAHFDRGECAGVC